MTVIGIDLGTTTSGVSAVRDNQLIQIPQDSGDYLIPSVVHFEPDGTWQVGVEALNQIVDDPGNTIFDIKRIIGRSPDENEVRDAAERLPYRISTEANKTEVIIREKDHDRRITPEYVSSLILKQLKDAVERHKTEPITKVVVTVPATFALSQREATLKACQLAGFNDCKLLNEPTAAILGYNSVVPLPNNCKILVFDLGGGTFDLSAVEYTNNQFQVKGIHGHPYLGGRDFDNHLMQHCIEVFQKNPQCKLNSLKNCDMSALRDACESAKKRLTFNETTKIRVRRFYNEIDLCVNVSRIQFENMIDLLCQRLRSLTEELLNAVTWRAEQIDCVFPIGGSIRIPKIQELLNQMFTKQQIRQNLNPDTAVLNGAAWYAHRLEQKKTKIIQEIVRLGIGISDNKGRMSYFIKPNSQIPITYTHPVKPAEEWQTEVQIDVYEGNDKLVINNQCIGQLRLAISRHVEFENRLVIVTFHMNSQGLLQICASDKHSGREQKLTLEYSTK